MVKPVLNRFDDVADYRGPSPTEEPVDGDPSTFCQRLRACLPGKGRVRDIDAKTPLYMPGQQNNNLYIVERGFLKTQVLSHDARQCIIDICGPGHILGDSGLLSGERLEMVVAMTPAVLRVVTSTEFFDIIARNSLVEDSLRYFPAKLEETRQIISYFVTYDSERRLAATLLRLARKIGKRQCEYLLIDEKITQEELAEIVGTTRSRIGFFLKRFREAGFVHYSSYSTLHINESQIEGYLLAEACAYD